MCLADVASIRWRNEDDVLIVMLGCRFSIHVNTHNTTGYNPLDSVKNTKDTIP